VAVDARLRGHDEEINMQSTRNTIAQTTETPMLRAVILCLVASLALPAVARAVTAPLEMPARVTEVLQRGTPLIDADTRPILSGEAARDASLDPLARKGGTTDAARPAFRVTTHKAPAHHYSIEARVPASGGVQKGDVVFAAWWMRAAESRNESGEAITLFRLQRTRSPWERTLYGDMLAGPEWKLVYRASRAMADVPADQLAAVFSAGYPRQAFDIAGLRVSNLGPDADLDALPRMSVSYLGDDPDAAWRQAAADRIERHRKADLTIDVIDADGDPVTNATVTAELTRHAFWFGSAFAADWLYENWDTPDGKRYREKMVELFNGVALENDLKWARWENNPDVALKVLRWFEQHDVGVHGHVLVWPGLEKFRVQDADEVWAAAQDDPDVLRRRIDHHIVDILTATHGLVQDWDVVNEPYTQHEFLDLLGRDEMVHWFKLADKHAPDANLFLNDFSILAGNGLNSAKQDFMYDTVRYLLDEGAPIDAMGFQAHMGGGLTPPFRLMQILDRFAELGLPIMITEFDVVVSDPAVQEQYTRDFMTLVFSHPSVSGFTTWGFWQPRMWTPASGMFDDDWNLMPVGKAFTGLVHGDWKTHEQGVTDADGRFSLRGFKGTYRVTIDSPHGTIEREVQLTDADRSIKIDIGAPARAAD
jgi:GH35 family endo-1,4-beta-xylanase